MTDYHLRKRSDLHLARKLWHFLGVVGIAAVYYLVSRATALQLITFFSLLFIVNDILRHQIPSLNKALMSVFHPIMREHERTGLAGTSYLLLGCFVIIVFFPKPVVTLALLMLAIADPLASYVGILYGRDKILGPKSLQGSLAAFFACSLVSAFYFLSHDLMTDRLLVVALISGLIGAISELLPIGKIDDNLSFPIVCSSLLWVLFFIFGGF